jgi:hypothetical protein
MPTPGVGKRISFHALAACLALFAISSSGVCHAQRRPSEPATARTAVELDDEPPPSADPSHSYKWETSWYGWQTLLADGLSFGMIRGLPSTPGLVLGVVAMLVGTPIVHGVQGNEVSALLSFGVRLACLGLMVGGLATLLADDEPHSTAPVTIGLLGLGVMIVTDAIVLAYKKVLVKPARSQALLLPWADAGSGSVGMRVALIM